MGLRDENLGMIWFVQTLIKFLRTNSQSATRNRIVLRIYKKIAHVLSIAVTCALQLANITSTPKARIAHVKLVLSTYASECPSHNASAEIGRQAWPCMAGWTSFLKAAGAHVGELLKLSCVKTPCHHTVVGCVFCSHDHEGNNLLYQHFAMQRLRPSMKQLQSSKA